MKKIMFWMMLLSCISTLTIVSGCFSAVSGENGSAFSVVRGGVGQCSIEIPANANHVTKKAAEELQLWVGSGIGYRRLKDHLNKLS